MRNKYILRVGRFSMPTGTIVFEYTGHTYGLVNEDEYGTGDKHMAVTANADGSGPFMTVAIKDLEEINNVH